MSEHSVSGVFTRRELQVMGYLAEGLCAKRIATRMNISVGSARQYVQRVYQKLGVNNRIDALLTIRAMTLDSAMADHDQRDALSVASQAAS